LALNPGIQEEEIGPAPPDRKEFLTIEWEQVNGNKFIFKVFFLQSKAAKKKKVFNSLID